MHQAAEECEELHLESQLELLKPAGSKIQQWNFGGGDACSCWWPYMVQETMGKAFPGSIQMACNKINDDKITSFDMKFLLGTISGRCSTNMYNDRPGR